MEGHPPENARNVEGHPLENAGTQRVTRWKVQECRGSLAGKRRNLEGHLPENARNVEGHPPENAEM